MAEEQIRSLKSGKQLADMANAFAEARAAKLAEELAELRRADAGQRPGAAGAQREQQRAEDAAASEAQAEECKRLQEQVGSPKSKYAGRPDPALVLQNTSAQ